MAALCRLRLATRSSNSCNIAQKGSLLRLSNIFRKPLQTLLVSRHLSSPAANLALTDEQKQQFEEEGYLIINDVLDKEHIQRMKDALDECEERAKHLEKSTNHLTLDPMSIPGNSLLQRVHIPSLLFPVFEETIKNEKILDIVSDLIGPNIRYIRQDKVNVKHPKGTGFPIKWHQDWAFNPHTNQDLVMICISIDDTNIENGCLQVVPKSHKGPLLSHYRDGEFASAINDHRFDPSKAKHLEVPSGGISLHHVSSIHGSAINRSKNKRRLYVYQYCSTDAWPLLGVSSNEFTNIGPVDWDRFTSTLVRGKCTLYPRMEKIDIALPVPFDKGYVFEHQDSIVSTHDNPQ
ncbi:predicted protein [Nematostella vectensis]|uniref:Phytanoyl-CoA dioxygenase n=1 Tax=Nematostella vectensis TaxID=45351 RepID=A7RJA0_NEMVE|nr:probable alpha-ketoglutarate-dependent hypophosphite dioxygenase [Nematostella vectensis]EDO48545.1 predicted protein [Nematostella vectensis]|eukprot:XP_001640608.1 predicted protein [Nematostella vectensis]